MAQNHDQREEIKIIIALRHTLKALISQPAILPKPQNCYPPSQIGYELRNHGHLSSPSANQSMTPIQEDGWMALTE
ncbi:hypothetical protein PPACK8108_LOCUS16659 [Phakopsora pachyrhizi]|uniref:Uncharacterized protein n=1 Tax=Phakopsora pachyrhizi TaxID=170000 RepID=A0AAV0BBT5_PHAPC|nr:hypothetical protein PPACK8108_LOCUS16659 [Phakopsora pachyrhizi]